MVEILLRVKDSELTGDPTFDSKVSRAGDVIVACPDGWRWGDMEMSHDFWRIVRLPNLPPEYGDILVAAEPAKSPEPDPTLQFRLYRFSLDDPSYSKEFMAYLADDRRTQDIAAKAAYDEALAKGDKSATLVLTELPEIKPDADVKVSSDIAFTAVAVQKGSIAVGAI